MLITLNGLAFEGIRKWKSLGKKRVKKSSWKYLNFPSDAVNGCVHGSLEIITGKMSVFRWRGGELSSHRVEGDKKTRRNKKKADRSNTAISWRQYRRY